MRHPFLLPLGFALAVAACSGRDDGQDVARLTAPSTAAVLAGIDLAQPLRALGTEPFWSIDITPQRLAWSGVDQPEITAANPGPLLQGTTAVFDATGSDGQPLTVTLMATECSDGMSDRLYPLTAQVEVAGRRLNGCALPTAALSTLPPA